MKNILKRPVGIWICWGTGFRNPELRVDFMDDTHHDVELIGENGKDALIFAMRKMADVLEESKKEKA